MKRTGMRVKRPITKWCYPLSLCALAGLVSSCTPTVLSQLLSPTNSFNNRAQSIPRTIQVAFVNNTPFRAIFTFGAFNPLDQNTVPLASAQMRLEGNTASGQIARPCLQAFSVGGDELIRLIQLNEADPMVTVTDRRALVRGVNFSGAPLGDPLEAEPTEGTAEGVVELSGVDFNCQRTNIRDPAAGATLLLFTFEQDAAAPGGFRIDFSFFQE